MYGCFDEEQNQFLLQSVKTCRVYLIFRLAQQINLQWSVMQYLKIAFMLYYRGSIYFNIYVLTYFLKARIIYRSYFHVHSAFVCHEIESSSTVYAKTFISNSILKNLSINIKFSQVCFLTYRNQTRGCSTLISKIYVFASFMNYPNQRGLTLIFGLTPLERKSLDKWPGNCCN